MFMFGGGAIFALMRSGTPDFAVMTAAMSSAMLAVLIGLALYIPLVMALWFAPALVIFNDMQPVPALKSSFNACLKNIIPFLIYGIALFVLSLIASIPLFLGFLVLIPVIFTSIYTGYKDIYST